MFASAHSVVATFSTRGQAVWRYLHREKDSSPDEPDQNFQCSHITWIQDDSTMSNCQENKRVTPAMIMLRVTSSLSFQIDGQETGGQTSGQQGGQQEKN